MVNELGTKECREGEGGKKEVEVLMLTKCKR
jgi:hypothetical protein